MSACLISDSISSVLRDASRAVGPFTHRAQALLG